VLVHEDESLRRRWWLYRDEIYWEEEDLTEMEVKALALERQTRNDRRIRRAVAMMEQAEAFTAPSRGPIADEVKVFVWNRDGGRCVRCRSNERLEFDHIIPVAFGGASTARNLQLLCEACNRQKGASLA
jgi:5-methylcytosine-specific restriction endonuclease McrA